MNILELRPHQVTSMDSLRAGFAAGHRAQILYAPCGAGKCLGRDTMILMADGRVKAVQDILAGDVLIGPDGGKRNVVSVMASSGPLYRVTPVNGDPYIVNYAHILSLKKIPSYDGMVLADGRHIKKSDDIVNVNVEVFMRSNSTARSGLKGWRSGAIEFHNETSALILDPYWLGCWLGDGRSNAPTLCAPMSGMVQWWIDHATGLGHRVTKYKYRDGECPAWGIAAISRGGENEFTSSLRSLDLIDNKHVPDSYLRASVSDRLKLIAGMLDSDGYLDNHYCYEFTSKRKQLADGMAFLCRSVGLAAYVTKVEKGIRSIGFVGTYWRVGISGDVDKIPCIDKRTDKRAQVKRHLVHRVTIEAIGDGDYFGFSLDGDKLFLLGDFTVTHNTEIAVSMLDAAAKKDKRSAMIVDLSLLCAQTSARLQKYGIDHGVIQPKSPRYRPEQPIQVCMVQTLEAREGFPSVSLLVIDECFPAGTLIDTPDGPIAIELLKNGGLIYNCLGLTRIKSVFSKINHKTIKIRLSNGKSIECTEDHPVFTDMGWQPAGTLAVGTRLFCKQAVRELWRTNDSSKVRRSRAAGVGGGGDVQSPGMLRTILREEIEKPDALGGKQRQDGGHVTEDWTRPEGTRREWQGMDCTPVANDGATGGWMGSGVCGEDIEEQQAGLPTSLQNRYCESAVNGGYRDGRRQSLSPKEAGTGQKEGRASSIIRVESIAHEECPSGVVVYNLRVAGHPSYFAGGILVHNCHTLRSSVIEFIKNNPKVKVVGLSGSPFTKGLGATYTNVVSSITVNELVDKGLLINPKIFISKQIDMTGAKKVAGEWSDKEATARGIQITGDIVAEWVNKTQAVFGGPRKTIVFCAGVAHGADLSEKFAAAGFNFIAVSYKDDNEFKRQVLEDFSKPDTEIDGLIATDLLSKGFDVQDVCVGVSARPFSKSFSAHVQQMGRIMRPHDSKDAGLWLCHCIATGQRVLTQRGLVPIELILLTDAIWDGHDFVSHKGVISRGKRPTIRYAGLTATADHLVKTRDEGWCSIGYCAEKQKAITTTGVGWTALRECDGYFTIGDVAGGAKFSKTSRTLRVRHLWQSINNCFAQFTGWRDEGVSPVQQTKESSKVAERKSGCDAGAVSEPKKRAIPELWWKGNRVQVRLCDFLRSLDSRELGMLAGTQGHGIGSDGQQRELRAGEYSMGAKGGESKQSEDVKVDAFDASIHDRKPSRQIRSLYASAANFIGSFIRGNSCQVQQAEQQAEGEVWDIVDCGPRSSFTCEGLLVHNSGNYLRFRDQWDELCSDGVHELSDGAEKTKPEPTDKEKEAAKCPACSHLWNSSTDVCAHCGFIRQRKNDVVNVAGEMVELEGVKKKEKFSSEFKEKFYAQLLGYCKSKGQKPGAAYHRYKEKFGVGPSMATPAPIPPGIEVLNWIRSRQIAYAKGR